jgi:putative ABC transport system permease protein
MIGISLRSLWSRKLRAVLTGLAIVLGVSMIAGTYVLTDQINAGFTELFRSAYRGIDVVITRRTAFGGSFAGAGGLLPQSELGTVRRVPGVAAAVGEAGAYGPVVLHGKALATGGGPALVLSSTPPPFGAATYVRGAPPSGPAQVAVDRGLAKAQHIRLGEQIGIATEIGVKLARVSGVFTFAPRGAAGGTTIVIAPLPQVQSWFGLHGKLDSIYANATTKTTSATVVRRLRAALPHDAQVQTGAQAAASSSKALSDELGSFLTPVLLSVGGVAVLVGAFIIYNTFSITVSQRTREFALLRTIGASRRQILWAVLLEALITGTAASLLGLLAGLGLARAMYTLFAALGAELPSAPATLDTRTVIAALIIGLAVTLISALLPALRATRVPPVVALQQGAGPSRLGQSRLTPYLTALSGGIGVAIMVAAIFSQAALRTRLVELGIGAAACFVAVAVVLQFVVGPAAALLGRPLSLASPVVARLARENVARNPGRTAATAAALMVGLGVVVFVAVFAQGLKVSFVGSVDRLVQAPLIASNPQGFPIPAASLQAAARVPGVAHASGVGFQLVESGDRQVDLFAFRPQAFAGLWHFEWLAGGSNTLLARLRGDSAIVEQQFAATNHLRIGSRFGVLTQQGQRVTLRVIGEYLDPDLMAGIAVSSGTFDRLFGPALRDPFYLLVGPAPGAALARVEADLKAALKPFPAAQVQTKAQFTASVAAQVEKILTLLYVLLAVSVLISLVGIVNTLVLAVYERTREIGMLRAIGQSRWQTAWEVLEESALTSLIGGLLGTALGVVFAYIVTAEFVGRGITFAVPVSSLALFLIAAVAAGVLAAVIPAQRAAHLDILETLRYE